MNTDKLKNDEQHLLWISIVIVAVFVISQTVQIVQMVYVLFHALGMALDLKPLQYLYPIAFLLQLINSSVNPFVYGFFSKKYRTVFMRIIKCEKKNRTEFRLSRSTKL